MHYTLSAQSMAEMASQGSFKYTQLQSSMNTTRVVDVLPGDFLSPVQCEMRVIDLDRPPLYCALSYVWGEGSEGHKISINQAEMRVTQRLHKAFQYLRSQEEIRTFWIDAICINQRDIQEKSAQVRKMQQIYRQSKEILIWLGPEGDGSDSAIELASKISVYWSDQGLNLSDAESKFRSKTPDDLSNLLEKCNCEFDSAPIEAFRSLIARDWFERVWTIQEAAAPVQIKSVQCGDSIIDWWGFIAAAKFLSHAVVRPDLKAYFPNAGPLGRTSLRGLFNLNNLQGLIESGRYQTDLLGTLANYRHYKATDPRDKVYALLGLVTEAVTDILVCDYSLDCRTVYLKVAEHCILHRGSLECLGYCNPSRDPQLPSWVPNWRVPSVRHPLAYWSKHRPEIGAPDSIATRMYSSSGNLISQNCPLSFLILHEAKLVTEGCCIGKAVTVGPPYLDDSDSNVMSAWEPEILQGVYGPTGETVLEAFSRTIVADVEKNGTLRKRGYSIDWNFWRSINDYTKQPASPKRRVEWGSLLFATVGRRFVLSDNGYMCLAPGETRPGDQICLLVGGHVFYILRPAEESWSLIGECYVHGFMDGEAISLLGKGILELQQFSIA